MTQAIGKALVLAPQSSPAKRQVGGAKANEPYEMGPQKLQAVSSSSSVQSTTPPSFSPNRMQLPRVFQLEN